VVRLLLQRQAAHRTPAACGDGHDSYQDCRMSDVVNATEAVLGLAAARTPSAGKWVSSQPVRSSPSFEILWGREELWPHSLL